MIRWPDEGDPDWWPKKPPAWNNFREARIGMAPAEYAAAQERDDRRREDEHEFRKRWWAGESARCDAAARRSVAEKTEWLLAEWRSGRQKRPPLPAFCRGKDEQEEEEEE